MDGHGLIKSNHRPIPPSSAPAWYDMGVPRETDPMFLRFSQEFFEVRYNEGLAGVERFPTIAEAIDHARGATTLTDSPISVHDRAGRLILAF
jgi:hypothetical protein